MFLEVDGSTGDDEFEGIFYWHFQFHDVCFWNEEEIARCWIGCSREKDTDHVLLDGLLYGSFRILGKERDGIDPFPGILDENGLFENLPFFRKDGLADLAYGNVYPVDKGYAGDDVVSHSDEFFTDVVSGNDAGEDE